MRLRLLNRTITNLKRESFNQETNKSVYSDEKVSIRCNLEPVGLQYKEQKEFYWKDFNLVVNKKENILEWDIITIENEKYEVKWQWSYKGITLKTKTLLLRRIDGK